MKTLTTISLFIFGVVVTAILAAGLIYYQGRLDAANPTAGSGNLSGLAADAVAIGKKVGPTAKSLVSQPSFVLDMKEIAKHNSASDCWLLINNKVYDVTGSISSHPGGAGTIIPYCGQEATQAFDTKDIGRPHSNRANAMLADYYIGDYNATIGQ